MILLVVVGTNTVGGLDLLLTAASGTGLGNGNGTTNVEGLDAVACALGGLSLTLFGPGVVHAASAGVGVWISHGIGSLVGSGTSMTKVQLSVIFCLAVSVLLSLVIAEDITEFEILDGLISWKTVSNSSSFIAVASWLWTSVEVAASFVVEVIAGISWLSVAAPLFIAVATVVV